MKHFETIDDSQLDQVAGGLSFNLGLDSGLQIESPLGNVSVPGPLTVANNLVGTLGGAVSDLLQRVGTKLGQLGQLFDFT